MKITFIHSPEDIDEQNYGMRFIPLWAYYLASYVPDHWDVEIIDCRLENLECCRPADIFAFGGINQDLRAMSATRELLKRRFPEATFLLGGPIAWSFDKEGKLDLLRHFDYIFILDGEETLPTFLQDYEKGNLDQVDQVIEADRYPFSQARKIRFELMDQKKLPYYGAVVEASRGCPFLCEFCDIRVLPNNNRPNNKDIRILIEEIEGYYQRGVTRIQLACDNFIGDPKWANECIDAIIDWKEQNQARIALFTWATINLYKMPRLMTKMRKAGMNVLFIGIESVNRNSLLETAKVQNVNALEEAVKTIHSYGFIIAPGLIFGFDSDTETVFEDTLDFWKETGVLGVDPSFLTAPGGTPLYARMKRGGRLIEREAGAVARHKIMTNIRYLLNKDFLVNGFTTFVKDFTEAAYQFELFKSHVELAVKGSTFVAIEAHPYAAPLPYLKTQLQSVESLRRLGCIARYLLRPDRVWVAFKAWVLVRKCARRAPGLSAQMYYWLHAWVNMALKYEGLTPADFALHSVDADFDRAQLLTDAELSAQDKEQNRKDGIKVDEQQRYTQQALQKIAQYNEVSSSLPSSQPSNAECLAR